MCNDAAAGAGQQGPAFGGDAWGRNYGGMTAADVPLPQVTPVFPPMLVVLVIQVPDW